jgi:hypothetical protein
VTEYLVKVELIATLVEFIKVFVGVAIVPNVLAVVVGLLAITVSDVSKELLHSNDNVTVLFAKDTALIASIL